MVFVIDFLIFSGHYQNTGSLVGYGLEMTGHFPPLFSNDLLTRSVQLKCKVL